MSKPRTSEEARLRNIGENKLGVLVYCHRCNLTLARDVFIRHQTKGGNWDIGVTILARSIESHLHCQDTELETKRRKEAETP